MFRSPVGLAAYFLDHDARSYELIARVFDGQSEGLTRDDILDNITITWLTNTALFGARLYWENKLGYFNAKGVSIPVAVSTVSIMEFRNGKVVHETQYFGDPFEAPAWRRQWVQQTA